ncbi:uncharacterized protein LOC143617610 [Bidens hawaiensis]|uniref:uncharacterized protein LOC143617610 n=1 Tax=Bidens hawaiensis TaxID=980011 RepID=UPI00404A3D2D
MAPPSASTQAPAIKAPHLNQVAQTPQGSNRRAFIMNVNQAQSSSDGVNASDKLSKTLTIEVAEDNSIIIASAVRDCVIVLNKVEFLIYLILMKMGSFDVIIGMDWLTFNHAEIVCFEKFIRIPLENGRILKVFGDTPTPKIKFMSCFIAQRYICKKCVAFLALVVDKERKEKKLSDIPVVRDFSVVFPDDVTGLPLVRQVEF